MAVGSFSAGLSGLNANAQALAVVGNNLANINTVGFKGSAVAFRDLVYQDYGGAGVNPTQIGLGVGLAQVSPVFTQGTIEASRVPTNVAIQGNGFFMLGSPQGASFTRAGVFSLDADGKLVSPDGLDVQGFTTINPVTQQVVVTGAPTSITIPPGVLHPPTATSQFSTMTNLDADALVGDTFTTSIQIYDSLGASHVTTMTYTKTAAGAWSYDLSADGAEVTGGTPGTPFSLGTGTLAFNGNGILTAVNGGAPANLTIATPTWTNGALSNTFNWEILDTNGNPVLTGFSSPSTTSSITQNGAAAGAVTNITINPNGDIVASIGSGQTLIIGRIALVTFNNPQGLNKIGSNRYTESAASGVRNVGVPGSGGRGVLAGSALEQSNVDMAQEFTQMILYQRGYQANGKLITVSDQLLLDTLNLKT